MAQAGNQELTEQFIQFYRNYYRDEIGKLAQRYPNEQRSLYIRYDDLYTFDADLAEDLLDKPDQLQEYAEEALRLYDLPADVSLGQAHVRIRGLPDTVDIRNLRVHDNHVGRMIAVQGIVRKATDVRPKVTDAAFECQRCGTMTYIPQSDGSFQEPHECQGCERQGPFHVNLDQSEFVDAQKIRVQESPEGLRGGETPQSIDVTLEDDITGEVTAGDHLTVVGALHMEQQTQGNEKTPLFDLYMDGVSITIEDEEFEDMEIDEDDVAEIVELSQRSDIYEAMVDSVAPSIYGYEEEKLSMVLQLFSGVTKHLPDGSRIRGDLHMLLIGDPGTGKCVRGDTRVTLSDGRDSPIREVVESNLDDPKPVDDGVWDHVDLKVPSMQGNGTIAAQQATKVWKREAPEKLYRIRTASGREVTITPSHPLFTQVRNQPHAVRAEDLSEGEFIATPRTVPTDGVDSVDVEFRRSRSHNGIRLNLPDRWTPWLARLIGYIVAEGYVEQRRDEPGFVSITNNDQKVIDDATEAFDRLGLNPTVREPHNGNNAREVMCSADELVSFLAALSPTLFEGSDRQGVPEDIMRAEQSIKRAFLQSFIEGEEHISDTQQAITVASMSRELLEDIRSLLLTEGIQARLRARENGRYRLRISGDDFETFESSVTEPAATNVVADGGTAVADKRENRRSLTQGDVAWDQIESIEAVESDEEWVYDLEVAGTHNYISNGIVSHNSQMLSYIQNVAPRSVYTSGKGTSSAGLTAAAVRDDFGDGQQWTLEAGALVLADKGVAAVDELDKMRSEDRSAMHEALEQQQISISKAGINATLKSRCSLLGAANPKYGRFDQYEPIGEQIDLEPALISRFDLIFTVTDQPDEEKDANLAEHILQTNYAGELNTQRTQLTNPNFSQQEVDDVSQEVSPEIEPELFRKYIAYSKRNCFPAMTEEAKKAIRDFYVDLRAKGADEDAPVPVTARKLEALVRLAEASARVRLSDTVDRQDAEKVIEIVRSCLQDIGVDPETGEFDADVVETGTSKSQRDRIKGIKDVIREIDKEYEQEPGAPMDAIVELAQQEGMERGKVEAELEKLRTKGDVYSPTGDQYKVV